ncbi:HETEROGENEOUS NUCLEAR RIBONUCLEOPROTEIN [Salix purpurea]|uniref:HETEROGENEOUS NUCLEAR RIBONUCLEOPROTEIN n=1 Tax=Salix purpurea TaxID=77065 RepID=A0A9Q0VVU4_SALPP|nr:HETEROGENEOUS NUCLEAR RIBONUCLEOPROTEIN [Salix purpurea]
MPSRPVKQASTRDEATLPKKIKPPPPPPPNDRAAPPNNLPLPSNNEEVERENKETHEVEEVSNEVEDCQDVRFKVFVGGLDNYATEEEDLRKVFGGVEELTKVRLIWDSKSERRVAFLTFATVELARHAICEISDPLINGRRCWTAQIQDGYKTLYIPNICNEWTKDDVSIMLLNYISTYGEKVRILVAHVGLFCCVRSWKTSLRNMVLKNYEVLTLNPDRENKEKNRGYAHLDFRSSKDASEALELLKKENVSFGQNRAAKVDFASKYVSGNDEIMSHVKKVYLDGMPRAWMEEHVKEHLEKLGRIVKVQLARHTPSSIRTNYCYVTFETHEAAVACVNGVNVNGLYSGNRKVNAWAALAKPRVRITSNKTEQACSSETGQGNEVQQESHSSGTDAPSGIDRSKRSETRNAEPQSVGKKKAVYFAGEIKYWKACLHEEVCPRSTETFVQRSRAHVDHENSSRRNSQRKEHSSRTGYGDEGASHRPSRQNEYSYERNTKQPSNYYETHSRDYNHTSGSKSRHSALEEVRPHNTEPVIQRPRARVDHENFCRSYSQSSFRKDHSSRTGFVEGASSSVRNSHGLSDTRTSAVVSRGCKVDRGDGQRMPSRNGKDYKSRDHPRAASNDAHEEAHSSDNHRSRVKDGGSRSRGGSSRKYHKGRVAQHHQGR